MLDASDHPCHADSPTPTSGTESPAAYVWAAMQVLPLLVAFIDRDWRFRFVNREFEKWYRVRGEAAIGRRVDEVCPPKTYAKLRKHIEQAQNGRIARFVGRVSYPDGRTRFIRATYRPFAGGNGMAAGVIGMIADVSREKQAELEVRRSRASLANAQRVANIGNWDWDILTNDLAWSDQIYRIFGLAPQQFEASYPAFLSRVHPEDQGLVEETVRQAVENRAPYDIHHRIVLPSGAVRVVHEQGEVRYGAKGRPLRMTGTVQDVTERHHTHEALRRSRAMLSGILSISPEAIIVADQALRISLFSAGAEQVFGYAAAEILGAEIERLMPSRFRAGHARHVEAFVRGTETSRRMAERGEIVALRKGGEEFPAEASISKLRTPDGWVYTIILRDISAQKRAHQDLLEAKLKAEAANQAKSLFLANMSHELRTPLNAIIGFSEMFTDEALGPLGSEKYRECARDIHSSGEHLLSVINDILDASRLELGKTPVRDEVVDVGSLIRGCVRMIRQHVDESEIDLRVLVADESVRLWADRRLLSQVLLNLLSNAVKFTPQGGRVEVHAHRTEASEFEIAVRDEGIGMSEADVRRVGEPFVQADNRPARRYGGTGLGLSIAKGIIELHGGRLSIESAPNQGTRVAIYLPADRVRPG